MRPAVVPLLLGVGAQLIANAVAADEEPETHIEVEVRAAPLSPAAAPKDPSVAGSTIRRGELQAPGLSAADALRTQVGVALVETGAQGAPATASVRGATASETPVYVGGVRINDDVAGAADLSTVPLWLMDRVEVYRGNAPLEADRLTIGGAIFFEPLRPNRDRAGLGALGGSYGSRGAFAYAGSGGASHGLLLGVRLEGAENDYPFADNGGTPFVDTDDKTSKLQNADVSMLDVWLLGTAAVGDGRIDLLANHFEREQGATGIASVRSEAARQSLLRTLASVSGHTLLGESTALELRSSGLFGHSVTDDPGNELLLGSERVEIRGERFDQALNVRSELGSRTTLRAGVEAASERFYRYEGVRRAGTAPTLDALRSTGRVVAGAEIEVAPDVSLRLLGALECHDTHQGNGDGCDALEPGGRLGALWTLGSFAFFGGVARYARIPTLGELYGMSLAVHGNPELESETGLTADAGARFSHRLEHQTAPLYVALSGYFRKADQLISFDRTAQGHVTPKNVDAARAMGLEVEAGSGFARYFDGRLGVTAFDGRDQSPGSTLTNDILPYHSRLIASAALRATTPVFSSAWFQRASLGTTFLYQSNRYANPAGVGIIPEQSSLDLDAALAFFGGSTLLRARVADVLDTPRFDVVGFPLPGRSVFVSLELRTPEPGSSL